MSLNMEKLPKQQTGHKIWFLVTLFAALAIFLIYTVVGSETVREKLQANLKRDQLNLVPVLRKDMCVSPASVGKTGNASKEFDTRKRGHFTGVILVTYMRSGSSLTGEILQQPYDTFYVFEPLKSVEHIHKKNGSISYLNGTVLINGRYNLQTVYLETLIGWLTCNFSKVHVESLLDTEFLQFSDKLKPFLACIYLSDLSVSGAQNVPLMQRKMEIKSEQFQKCLADMKDMCLQSKYRIVKTIRTKLSSAVKVLQQIDEGKVIHLVRDPRATLESRSHRNVCSSGLNFCIREHCQRVWEDTEFKERLKSRRRIYTLKYENIASRPILSTKSMYNFIGMKFTPKISEYVYNITLGNDQSQCKVCKTRWQIGSSTSSSRVHIDAWKRKLPLKFISSTQRLCRNVMKYYGYEYYGAPNNKEIKTAIIQRKKQKNQI